MTRSVRPYLPPSKTVVLQCGGLVAKAKPSNSEQPERIPTEIHERGDDAPLYLHHRIAIPPAVLVCEGGDVLDPAGVGALVRGVDAEFPPGADGEREHTGLGHQLRECGGRGGQCRCCGAGAGAGEEGGEDEGEGEHGWREEGAVRRTLMDECIILTTVHGMILFYRHPSSPALLSETDPRFLQPCSPVHLQSRTLFHCPDNHRQPLAES